MKKYHIQGFVENDSSNKLIELLKSISFKGYIIPTNENIKYLKLLCDKCKEKSVKSGLIDSYCSKCQEKIKKNRQKNK